jgi:hypothetical protein
MAFLPFYQVKYASFAVGSLKAMVFGIVFCMAMNE